MSFGVQPQVFKIFRAWAGVVRLVGPDHSLVEGEHNEPGVNVIKLFSGFNDGKAMRIDCLSLTSPFSGATTFNITTISITI